MKFRLSALTAFFLLLFSSGFAQKSYDEKEVRTLVTLLDYVAKDYPGAVEKSKVISDTEYQEITEFTQTCISLHSKLNPKINKAAFSVLKKDLDDLLKFIREKVAAEKIDLQSHSIKEKILAMGLLKLSPKGWPSLKSGTLIYKQKCASCHGEKGGGDGALAANLSPKPANFLDKEVMSGLSPLQAYNVIKLGLEGTPMRSFSELSERELWDISFYIMSLRHINSTVASNVSTELSIDTVSRLTDDQLSKYLKNQQFKYNLAQVRSYQPKVLKPLEFAKFNLDESLAAFKQNDKTLAQDLALTAYLEGVELVEASIKSIDAKVVANVERAMINYRSALTGNDARRVEELNAVAKKQIDIAGDLLGNKAYSYSFTFGAALSILLREALEALIIIIVVLSILRPLNIKKAINYIHIGWIVALLVGIASWFFIGTLIKMSGSSRELMEGIGSIIAVIVLIYMGAWLHTKSEIKKWKEFVELKISKVAQSGKWYLLMFFSFIVVFREAFEVVLFLATLKLDVPEEGSSAIGWAVITAAVLVTLFSISILRYSKRLPLRQIFKISAYVMAVLTVVLTGKGFRALQEAGYFSENMLKVDFRLESLGIYPTVESLLAQMVVLLIVLGLWKYSEHKESK